MVEQDNTFGKSFWKAERRYRHQRELSQRAAAPILGMSQPELSRRESNDGKIPDREAIIQFSNELELDSIEIEVFLASGGLAWTQSFYRDLLKILDGDNELTDRTFTNGEIEVILDKSLQVLRLSAPDHANTDPTIST